VHEKKDDLCCAPFGDTLCLNEAITRNLLRRKVREGGENHTTTFTENIDAGNE